MKQIKKMSLAILAVFVFVFSFVVVAKEDNSFLLTDVTYDDNMKEEIITDQNDQAVRFQSSLDRCKKLSYETKIEETTDRISTIIAETSGERDEIISEKDEEGYTTSVTGKTHDAVILNYNFTLINDRVTEGTINESSTSGYNGKSSDEIMNGTEFADFEDENVIMQHTITTDIHDVSGSNLFTTRAEADAYSTDLTNQGYTTNVIQNNTTRKDITLKSSSIIMNSSTLRNKAMELAIKTDPNKEILDLNVGTVSLDADIFTEETEEAANALAEELENSDEYFYVSDVYQTRDYENAVLESEGNTDGVWNPWQTGNEYDEFFIDLEIVGYRHYYRVIDENSTTQTVIINTYFGPNAETSCNAAIDDNANEGYENLTCVQEFGIFGRVYELRGDVKVPSVYYDEYIYPIVYAIGVGYFSYPVSYIPTDYTVNYSGTEGTISIRKSMADKYYEIDAERPKYTIVTNGTIVEDKLCLNPKTIDTGVKENIIFEVMSMISACSLAILLENKTRKSN